MNVLSPTIAADDPRVLPEDAAAVFARDGVLGPIQLFTEGQCRLIAARLRRPDRPEPIEWLKGHAASDRFWYDLATRPPLIRLMRSLLGDDCILYAARTIQRPPGKTHTWHTDIESCSPNGRFVSVWVGLENTSSLSGLHVVTRTHLTGQTLQQVLQERNLRRRDASAQDVLALAREFYSAAGLHQPAMTNGDMMVFDGRLWHGTHNADPEATRVALLLQYAAADTPVRLFDPKQAEWPFRYLDEPRPPVIVISGTAPDGVNRVVRAPRPDPAEPPLMWSAVHQLALPLAPKPDKHWGSEKLLRGRSTIFDFMDCHVTTLYPGPSPHVPHTHPDEELEIVLDGEVEFIITEGPAEADTRIERIGPGKLMYYPPHQHHTLRNAGTAPATHLVFKWRGTPSQAAGIPPISTFDYGDATPDPEKPWWTKRIIRTPTGYLGRLGCHLTVLQAGHGYPPHRDPYDIGIVLLAGDVETLGERLTAPALIYYAAGEPHGMRNVGDQPARYLVFEFHAPEASRPNEQAAELKPLRKAPSKRAARPEKAKAKKAVAKQAKAKEAKAKQAKAKTAKAKKQKATKAPPQRKPATIGRRLARWVRRTLGRSRPAANDAGAGAIIRQADECVSAGDLAGALAIYNDAPEQVREHPKIVKRRKKIARLLQRQEDKASKKVPLGVR